LISPLWYRFDESRLGGRVAQGLADLFDVISDDFRIDIPFLPERLEKFIRGHEPSWMFDKVMQDVEGLWG
jgi:hypothetical protein